MQDIIGYLLIFHLVGMARLFDEDQIVFLRGRHMVIQIAQELRWISVGEIVVGSDKQRTGMRDLFRL